MAALPKLTENLERVIYIKPLPKANSKAEYFYSLILFLELLKTYDISSGFIYIIDCSEVTLNFISLFDFQFQQRITNFTVVRIRYRSAFLPSFSSIILTVSLQNSISGKFSKIIGYKAPIYADIFLKILRMCLKPKLFERVNLLLINCFYCIYYVLDISISTH